MAREADIRWSKQFEFSKLLMKAPPVATDHYGLYMILETLGRGHRKQPIYIGIVKSERRDLYKRTQEHRKDWLHSVAKGQIFVKFGVVYTHDKIDGQLIEDIESALVFGAQPRENTAKMRSYSLYHDVKVRNINHEGFLKPTYDTAVQRKLGR